mgnify:CR=1 FL=1
MDKQSNVKGFTILSAASIINKLLGILYVPALTLILGNVGNGIYNAGFTVYTMVFVITTSGIPVAISKLISEQVASSRYDISYKTLRISSVLLISFGAFTSIVMAAFAKQFSGWLGYPESYMTILALSPTMLFTAVSCTFRGYFQGRSNMVPTSISQVIEQAVNSVFTILFAWIMYRYGSNYAVAHGITEETGIHLEAVKFAAAGGTVGTSLGALASAIYLVKTYAKNKADILKELAESAAGIENRAGKLMYSAKAILKKIFQYSIPITLGSAAIYSANLIDLKFTKSRLIAGGFSNVEATALYGIFSTQYLKVLFLPVTLATALAVTIVPSVSAAAAVNDRTQLGRRISESIKMILMISIPSAAGMTVLAKPIVRILFPSSPDGWDLLMIGSWTVILISLVSVQTAVLQGIGKTYIPTVHMVIGLAMKVFINYNLVAVRAINIKGAVAGSAVCYLFAFYMNYRSIKKLTGVRLNVKKLFNRPFSISVIMAVLVLLVYKGFELITEGFIGSVTLRSLISGGAAMATGVAVYYLLMIAVRGITAREIKSLPGGSRILAFTLKIPYMDRFLR